MSESLLPPEPHGLPNGWMTRAPVLDDVDDLVALVDRSRTAITGTGGASREWVAVIAAGEGSWTRRQRLFIDPEGRLSGWIVVHDRAAGRTNVELTVDPELDDSSAASVSRSALAWTNEMAIRIARGRGLGGTQLDASLHQDDPVGRSALSAGGFVQTRTWLQMRRPVDPSDSDLDTRSARGGVRVRPVRLHSDRTPVAADLQTVHRMLEESFADHFNSYRESFPEFLSRLREDPGHRWGLWWIAEIDVETSDGSRQETLPGGALAATISGPDAEGIDGSYVEYIGVHRLARGRGVAKALLATVVADAARRGRNRVGLEVDADSPTGADGLYLALGWQTTHRTESWQRTVSVPGTDDPVVTPKGDLA